MNNFPISPWVLLGKPTLYLGIWTLSEGTPDKLDSILRIRFIFLDETFDGYVLLRNTFIFPGFILHCEAKQVYPSNQYTVVELPYPKRLADYGDLERRIQARPRQYNRKYGAGLTQAPLEIEIEELVPFA